MDVNKNSYTFTFAGIMVVLVALLLSVTAISLKPLQDKNIRLEKMQNILSTIDVRVAPAEAEKAFETYITKQVVVGNTGSEKDGINAFTVDMAKELKNEESSRNFPLFIAEKSGETFYIVPVRGKGLWGPIWGYLAFKGDLNTVYGATFDHKSETPGLGAEISTNSFQKQFTGKKILAETGDFKSIEVRKGDASGEYQVDGISGGTITSVGVEEMIRDCIKPYLPYFKTLTAMQSDETQTSNSSNL